MATNQNSSAPAINRNPPSPAPLSPPRRQTAPPVPPQQFQFGARRPTQPSMYKNLLQEYLQKNSLPLPQYHTTKEGVPHETRFRGMVVANGVEYHSPNVFPQLKAAEQDAARVALEDINTKQNIIPEHVDDHENSHDIECQLIIQDEVFCKSILNEFAAKSGLEKPVYTSIQPENFLPVFISTVSFSGLKFTGNAAGKKKNAEQLAARAAIDSLLNQHSHTAVLIQTIKSKKESYNAIHKYTPNGIVSGGLGIVAEKGSGSGIPASGDKEPEIGSVETNALCLSAAEPESHEFVAPTTDTKTDTPSAPMPISLSNGVASDGLGNVAELGSGSRILAGRDKDPETGFVETNAVCLSATKLESTQSLEHKFVTPKTETKTDAPPASMPIGLPIEFAPPANEAPSLVGPSANRQQPLEHKFVTPKTETITDTSSANIPISLPIGFVSAANETPSASMPISLPIEFVPPANETPSHVCPSANRRRKMRKKANKRSRLNP